MERKKRWNFRQRRKKILGYKSTVESVLDKRDNYFKTLEAFEKKNNYIPAEIRSDAKLMQQYAEWKKEKSWRNNKRLQRKINRRSK